MSRDPELERQMLDEIVSELSEFPDHIASFTNVKKIEDAEINILQRVAWFRDKNELNALRRPSKRQLGRFEDRIGANDLKSGDSSTRKRKSTHALQEQLKIVEDIRKRMRGGLVDKYKPEEEEEVSQELGTILSP